MASQRYERVILEPPHAAFGYPGLSLCGLIGGVVFMASHYFIPGLGFAAAVHVVSMVLRHRAPHGEQLFIRGLGKSRAFKEWTGARRVYHG